MSVWLDLDGEFDTITKEQERKFALHMIDAEVKVDMDGDGYFSFHDECSSSFWDNFTTSVQEFCDKEKVCCTVNTECEGDEGTDYFGSDDDQERLNYFDCKREYDDAKRTMDMLDARITPEVVARWTLESGG